jgi:DNA-binding FadR family transcriptional regulator
MTDVAVDLRSGATEVSGAAPAAPTVVALDAVFAPVRTANTFEETVERILQSIKLGVVGFAERLPSERELAVRMGVSRVTVREALRALQEAGYVDARRGRYGGTFVTFRPDHPPSTPVRVLARGKTRVREISDVLTFRHVLEVGAAEAAARRGLDEQQRAYLLERLAATEAADLYSYRQCDARLHLAVAEVTGSTSLATAIADIRMDLDDLLNSIPLLERNIEHSNVQHRRIVEAIVAGNPRRARAAMEEHVEGTAALLRGFLRAGEDEPQGGSEDGRR